MNLNWSIFNFIEKYNDKYLLYNSFTNNLIELEESDHELLVQIKSGNLDGVSPQVISDLKDNYILVESDELLINKIKLARLSTRFSSTRMNLTLAPTTACNFICPYCYEEGADKNKTMNEQTEDEIIKLVSSYSGLERLNVDWYGGEPLLAFDTVQSLTKKLLALPVNEYKATLVTNGYLLDRDKILKLKELKISQIQITLDGLEETHNARRPHRTNKDSFSRIVKNIDDLNKLYPEAELHIRVNIDKDNAEDFFKLHAYFKDKFSNPRSFVYPAYITDFNPCKQTFCFMNRKEQADFALKNLDKFPFGRFYYPITKLGECIARFMNSYIIGPEGELYKCWCDVGEKDKIVGNLREGITNTELYTRYMTGSDPLYDAKCTKCSYFPICNGGCAFRRLKNNQANINEELCTIQKDKIRDFIKAYYEDSNR